MEHRKSQLRAINKTEIDISIRYKITLNRNIQINSIQRESINDFKDIGQTNTMTDFRPQTLDPYDFSYGPPNYASVITPKYLEFI